MIPSLFSLISTANRIAEQGKALCIWMCVLRLSAPYQNMTFIVFSHVTEFDTGSNNCWETFQLWIFGEWNRMVIKNACTHHSVRLRSLHYGFLENPFLSVLIQTCVRRGSLSNCLSLFTSCQSYESYGLVSPDVCGSGEIMKVLKIRRVNMDDISPPILTFR